MSPVPEDVNEVLSEASVLAASSSFLDENDQAAVVDRFFDNSIIYFILFYFILFYFILFYFILFYFILFILFHFILFSSLFFSFLFFYFLLIHYQG